MATVRAVRAGRAGRFALVTTVALAVAVVAAVVTGAGSGAVTLGVESLSSSSSTLLDRLASFLPLGFAFGAGMVSAANPCGFAMLPAFLALFVSDDGGADAGGVLVRFRRALHVGAAVTAGFVLLFGTVGLVIAAGAQWLATSFPWLGLAAGVSLIAAGAWLTVGGTLYTRRAERLSTSLVPIRGSGSANYFAFGLAFGIASLSCTLPVFLAVLGSGLTLASAPATVLQLGLYGLGMGLVITLLALSIAVLQSTLIDRVRRIVPHLARFGTGLLLVAGTYIVYYWLTVGGLLDTAVTRG